MESKRYYFEELKNGKDIYIGSTITTEQEIRETLSKELPNMRFTIAPNGLVSIY